jgi:TP901 family phage tail tape measure protein
MAQAFPLTLVIKAVDKATGPLRDFSAKVKGVSKAVGKAGIAMSAAVTAPLVALGGAGVAAFSRFEAGMGNVSTLIDTGVEDLGKMGEAVLAISRRAPVAVEDLTAALYDVRSAGVTAADQFRVLEGSARLAVAGLGTTKEAVDLVTSSINAFGLEGEEQARVYDLVFKTVKTGKTNISQLAQGFGAVAGTVASAGIKLDEYLASVAALTTTGLPAAQAHTQLRAAITGLNNMTPAATGALRRLGVKGFGELVQKSGGLVPALNKLTGVVKGNKTALQKMFGSVEAVNAVIGLTGRQGAAFTSTLEEMRTGSNALDEAFDKQGRTSVAALQRMRNSLESVAVSVGRILVPVLEQLVPVLERAATWWESLGGSGQRTLIVFAGAAAALGPALMVLGKLVLVVKAVTAAMVWAAGWSSYIWMMRASILAGLVPSLAAASASVWAFTAALLANPITWVVIAVVALGAAVYQIYKHWGPLKEFFWETWESLKGAVADGLAWIGEHLGWTPLGVIINNWEPIKAFFSELWDSIVGVFRGAWEKIKPIVDTVVAAGRMVFGGGEATATAGASASAARPVLGAEQVRQGAAGAAQSTEARVTVDFSNLPQGARVTPARGNTAPLELDVGYAMRAP